jgi:hypothetical protein
MSHRSPSRAALLALAFALLSAPATAAEHASSGFRVGIIGLYISHAPAFTRRLHEASVTCSAWMSNTLGGAV